MSRIPRSVRDEVLDREDEACAGCGWPRLERVTELHHRDARGMGGTSGRVLDVAANLLALHRWCHRWVHSHVEVSVEHGLIVPDGGDFASVPFRQARALTLAFPPSGSHW